MSSNSGSAAFRAPPREALTDGIVRTVSGAPIKSKVIRAICEQQALLQEADRAADRLVAAAEKVQSDPPPPAVEDP